LWQTFQAAKRWGTTPSALLHINDPYLAYCVDEAVGYFGSHIEQALDEVKGKNDKIKNSKRENLLRKYLGLKAKHRDIMELVNK
jgi:hypothetical protein